MGGIAGAYLYERDCFDTLIQSTFHLQHRGTASCAIDTSQADGTKIRPGKIKEAFSEDDGGKFKGNYGMGNVSGDEAEFVELSSSLGDFSLVYSGEIINSEELLKELKKSGESFSTNYESEILGRLISKGKDIVDGIEWMNEKVKGSYSIAVQSEEGLYVTRDPYGIIPLVIGESEEGYAFASESPALTELGFEDFWDVEPGEIYKIDEGGINSVGEMESERHAHCAFEWGYTARPDSIIEGIEVMEVRKKLGGHLARADDLEADSAGPVPQSGIGYAIGYQQESGILPDEFFYLNRYSDRSFIPTDSKVREQIAREKLSTIQGSIRGRILVILDDSIVRGTQIREKRNALKDEGAEEVHARIGCPALCAPCPYTPTTKEYSDLIYNRYGGDEEKIAGKLNLDSLKYNRVDDLIDAIGLPEEELCLGCFTDEYPTEI